MQQCTCKCGRQRRLGERKERGRDSESGRYVLSSIGPFWDPGRERMREHSPATCRSSKAGWGLSGS